MVTIKDVLDYAQKEHINVARLVERFDIDEQKACRVLKACWDRGLILPLDKSFFSPTPPDGSIPTLKARGSTNSTRAKVLAYVTALSESEGVGVGAGDVMEALELTRATARTALKALEDEGVLVSREASAGGSFGHLPIIWGLSEEDIDARDDLYIARAAEVIEERRQKLRGNKRAEGHRKRKKKPDHTRLGGEDVEVNDPIARSVIERERQHMRRDRSGKMKVDLRPDYE